MYNIVLELGMGLGINWLRLNKETTMTTVTGIVERVVEKTVNTKFGPKPVFDLYVNGTKYSWGWKRPSTAGVTDGANIKFNFEADKYGMKIVEGSVEVLAAGDGSAPVKKLAAVGGGSAPITGNRDAGFPVPVTSDKISILRQNALTNARELVQAYPSVFGVDKKPDEMVAKILQIASKFSDYTSGRDVEEKVAKMSTKLEVVSKE